MCVCVHVCVSRRGSDSRAASGGRERLCVRGAAGEAESELALDASECGHGQPEAPDVVGAGRRQADPRLGGGLRARWLSVVVAVVVEEGGRRKRERERERETYTRATKRERGRERERGRDHSRREPETNQREEESGGEEG